MSARDELKVRVIYRYQQNDKINMVTYIDPNITLEKLIDEVRDICNSQRVLTTNQQLNQLQKFTMKWIDDEGDACLLSCQEELDEMLTLCNNQSNKTEREIQLYIFSSQPLMPGMPCQGEDGTIYRRGARKWREKTKYIIYGHIYDPKRFNRKASCAYCHDRIWGLGRCGFKCQNCKLMVHKKCHKLCKMPCGQNDIHHPQLQQASQHQNRAPWEAQQYLGTKGVDHYHHQGSANEAYNDSHQTNSRSRAAAGATTNYHNGANAAPTASTVGANEQSIDMEKGDVDEQPQYKLEDFELLRVIGRGSYAKVLMVELKATKRIYAMKVIKKEIFLGDDDIDWVQTEKHVYELASNYPFLVGLHSCFQNNSRLFFVIEFVRGGDLMYHMQRNKKLHEDHARFYAAEISLALNYLHNRGIIYRDLKLDNVVLDHEGHIKLTDYGMCKEGIRDGEKTQTFCGTPNYISPELLRGEEYDFSVDWWALGVLLYEMLAGRSPFDQQAVQENNSEDLLFQIILEKAIRIPRTIHVRAQNILKAFLKKDPAERLGCKPGIGFREITEHEFFRPINWDLLERRQVTPPYKPECKTDRDLTHFDPTFTSEEVRFTPDNDEEMKRIDQSEFEGFEYVNPLLMSVEDAV